MSETLGMIRQLATICAVCHRDWAQPELVPIASRVQPIWYCPACRVLLTTKQMLDGQAEAL